MFALRCSDQNALLLTIRATSIVESFDLRVKDIQSNSVVLERVGEPVDPARPNRDISKPDQALKVAVEFSRPGNYLVYIVGRAGQGSSNLQFALRDFQVDGVREAAMLLVPLQDDKDGDGYPACGSQAVSCAQVACTFFDCDDEDPLVHPFATEVCGNGKDDDCSARCAADPKEGDAACVDNDKDGVPTPIDCDDNDPCRSPELHEEENLCRTKAEEFPALPAACAEKSPGAAPPYCGDGVDQDCNGQDIACKEDKDCDGFPPDVDCDDNNAEISPNAEETCDGVDNNCDTVIDEGCVPCDVDGDGHALPEVTDPECTVPRDDGDDYDAGVHPGTTADTGGKEGGTALGALRQYCSTDLDKNGKRHRDVDHDGDSAVAAADGCPAESCDADGDGFPGAQCNPPASQEDCNDGDPQIFPGAPDYCGDGIKQDCIADKPCTDDPDNDHYQGADDCDPARGDVHPWAVERCNNVDDDCDRLVDEGNPDSEGNLVPSDRKTCNDNNEGECAGGGGSGSQVCTPGSPGCSGAGRVLSGICACSKIPPRATRDEGNRVACPGEDLAAKASQRCFGATQPRVERCDAKDWDCNGAADDPTGANPMADKGKTCGTSVGNCKAGIVTGCDLKQNLAEAALIEKVLGDQGIEFNRYWVCGPASGQSEVWLPTAERCNGKDDDCDGTLPGPEQDPDSDKFIACTGCTTGGGRLDLAGAHTGCDDCGPAAPTIYPGAPEQCNGVDDNCQNGTSDDGATECTGGLTCCPDRVCRNLLTEVLNCGGCGNACPGAVSDSCVNGSCVCGGGTASCGPGLNCEGGACICKVGGRCSGCCEGSSSCRPGNTVAVCGSGGASCKSCVDNNECTQDECNSGSCSNPNEPRSVTCNGTAGHCYNGSCCTGCVGGGQCRTVNNATYCGIGGGDCTSCSGDLCQAAQCLANGTCAAPFPAGTECRAVAPGGCDLAEACSGTSALCPADSFQPASFVCRNVAAGGCDVAERCPGTGPACPADGFQSASFECRASAGVCDVAENCPGTGPACPNDAFRPASVECRAKNGACDVAENCTGFAAACPPNAFEPPTTKCSDGGPCTNDAYCPGTSGTCPANATRPDGDPCRSSAGICCGGSCCNPGVCCDGACCASGNCCGTTCCAQSCCGTTCCTGATQCCEGGTCRSVTAGSDRWCGKDGGSCTYCADPEVCNPSTGACEAP